MNIDNLTEKVRAQIKNQIFGSHDAGWCAWRSFWAEVVGIDVTGAGLAGLAQTCGWFAPYEGVAILQDRHNTLRLDEEGRLHCDDGPAVTYPDGLLSVWAWHGVRVTQQIIEFPDSITIDQIKEQVNMEVKRVMIERFGTGRYIIESGARLVDQDVRTSEGGSPRALFRDDSGMQYLVATDGSTKRVYWMNVSEDAKTCKEAHEGIAMCDEDHIMMEG